MFVYKQNKYQTRKIATWAAFFDSAGIETEYISDECTFFLPAMKIYAKVAGENESIPKLWRYMRSSVKEDVGIYGEPRETSAVIITGLPWELNKVEKDGVESVVGPAMAIGTIWGDNIETRITTPEDNFTGCFLLNSGFPTFAVFNVPSGLHFGGCMVAAPYDLKKIFTDDDNKKWKEICGEAYRAKILEVKNEDEIPFTKKSVDPKMAIFQGMMYGKDRPEFKKQAYVPKHAAKLDKAEPAIVPTDNVSYQPRHAHEMGVPKPDPEMEAKLESTSSVEADMKTSKAADKQMSFSIVEDDDEAPLFDTSYAAEEPDDFHVDYSAKIEQKKKTAAEEAKAMVLAAAGTKATTKPIVSVAHKGSDEVVYETVKQEEKPKERTPLYHSSEGDHLKATVVPDANQNMSSVSSAEKQSVAKTVSSPAENVESDSSDDVDDDWASWFNFGNLDDEDLQNEPVPELQVDDSDDGQNFFSNTAVGQQMNTNTASEPSNAPQAISAAQNVSRSTQPAQSALSALQQAQAASSTTPDVLPVPPIAPVTPTVPTSPAPADLSAEAQREAQPKKRGFRDFLDNLFFSYEDEEEDNSAGQVKPEKHSRKKAKEAQISVTSNGAINNAQTQQTPLQAAPVSPQATPSMSNLSVAQITPVVLKNWISTMLIPQISINTNITITDLLLLFNRMTGCSSNANDMIAALQNNGFICQKVNGQAYFGINNISPIFTAVVPVTYTPNPMQWTDITSASAIAKSFTPGAQ